VKLKSCYAPGATSFAAAKASGGNVDSQNELLSLTNAGPNGHAVYGTTGIVGSNPA